METLLLALLIVVLIIILFDPFGFKSEKPIQPIIFLSKPGWSKGLIKQIIPSQTEESSTPLNEEGKKLSELSTANPPAQEPKDIVSNVPTEKEITSSQPSELKELLNDVKPTGEATWKWF
jgi:hypothetical protein